MTQADYYRTLFDSLYWGRDQVLGAAAGLSDEDYAAPNGFSHHNIREILTHTLTAEIAYLARIMGTPAPAPDSPEAATEANLPSVESLKARWAEQEAVYRAYLATLTDEELEREVTFTRRDGVQLTQTVWQLLTTVYQHTLQHRSEAAEALTLIGRSPGGLDFPVYLAARATVAA